jgi:hypothetical protein
MARALTITQVLAINASQPVIASGLPVNVGGTTNFNLFDGSLGVLTSVTLTGSTHISVPLAGLNPFNTAITWQPSASANASYSVGVLPSGLFGETLPTQSATGPLLVIPPDGSASWSTAFDFNYGHNFGSPSDLAWFTGSGTQSLVVSSAVQAFLSFNTAAITNNSTVTLSYNYNAVPDSGSILAQGLIAGIFIAAFYRRRNMHSAGA